MRSVRSLAASAENLELLASSGYLFAVIDSTDLPRVPERLRQVPDRAFSLFEGTEYQDYYAVAPYLVQVDATLLQWVLDELNTGPWGVFAVSNQAFDIVAMHCRNQLFTVLGDGKYWYFRYYDPRVLEREFSENTARNWELFFGPLRGFIVMKPNEAVGTMYVLQ